MNSALVPASLRATAALADAGVIAQPAVDVGGVDGNTNVNGSSAGNVTIADVAALWESAAPALFEVSIDQATAENRLENFLTTANLSQALLNSTEINATSTMNSTDASNVTFYALSLLADGTPVQVCQLTQVYITCLVLITFCRC